MGLGEHGRIIVQWSARTWTRIRWRGVAQLTWINSNGQPLGTCWLQCA
jgi:hypothetical protein